MTNEIKEILTEWIYELYKAKGFDNITECNPAEFNIWEAKIKKQWDELEARIGFLDSATIEDYEEEIEFLERQLDDMINRNDELSNQVFNLRQILTNVSEAVNVTWN